MSRSQFCTVINCMDGRVQRPVNRYLRERFGVPYVDTITESGPVRLLAGEDGTVPPAIATRLRISVERHGSMGIAVAAHTDCAGHPVPDDRQREHLVVAVRCLAGHVPDLPVLGLWVEADGTVREVAAARTGEPGDVGS